MKRVYRYNITPIHVPAPPTTLLEKWKSDVTEFVENSTDSDDFFSDPEDPEYHKALRRAAKQCLKDAVDIVHYIEENLMTTTTCIEVWQLNLMKAIGLFSTIIFGM